MSDGPLFQNADEQERIYAPQQVPGEQGQVVADEGADVVARDDEPPTAGVIASAGSSPSSSAAVPNIGDADHGGAAGDPETEARYPINDRDPASDPSADPTR